MMEEVCLPYFPSTPDGEENVISFSADAACGYHLGWRDLDSEQTCPDGVDLKFSTAPVTFNSAMVVYFWLYVQPPRQSKKTVLYVCEVIFFGIFFINAKTTDCLII